MEKIFQSTEESDSSDYINSQEDMSESNASSTSYVISENADEVYSNVFEVNQKGGDFDTKQVTKELSDKLKETIDSIKENTTNIAEKTMDTLLTKEQKTNVQKNIQNFVENTKEIIKDPIKTINNATDKLTDIVDNAITKTQEENIFSETQKNISRKKAIKKLKKNLSPELIDQLVKNMSLEQINNINLTQTGGYRKQNNDRKYYEKYLKYKLKYLEMKYE